MAITPTPAAPIKVKKQPTITWFLIGVGLSIVIGIFLLWPKFSDFNQDNEQISDAQSSLQQLNDDQAKVNGSIKNLVNPNIANLQLAIPDRGDIPHLYAHLEALANSAGMHITSLQGNDDSKNAAANGSEPGANLALSGGTGPIKLNPLPGDLGIISIRAQLKGTYQGVNQFLAAIKSSLRLIDVNQIDLSSDQTDGSSITAQMTLIAYYIK